ncbi:MAG: hypothetical protein EB068_00295 [Betaproteobacteria bacterium]|nr:hypothetical protein [Betaproteobacteria bacterium]
MRPSTQQCRRWWPCSSSRSSGSQASLACVRFRRQRRPSRPLDGSRRAAVVLCLIPDAALLQGKNSWDHQAKRQAPPSSRSGDSIACIRRAMPKVTIRELTARVEAAAAEEMRLKATVERLQLVVREQAELLRGAGKGAAAVPAAAQRPIEFHCPICFEALNDLDPTLSCSHEICHKCCLKHFAEQINCPICRKKASPKELWRFRRPTLARYWKCLRGADWPKMGDIVVVTTTLHTLAGRMLETKSSWTKCRSSSLCSILWILYPRAKMDSDARC